MHSISSKSGSSLEKLSVSSHNSNKEPQSRGVSIFKGQICLIVSLILLFIAIMFLSYTIHWKLASYKHEEELLESKKKAFVDCDFEMKEFKSKLDSENKELTSLRTSYEKAMNHKSDLVSKQEIANELYQRLSKNIKSFSQLDYTNEIKDLKAKETELLNQLTPYKLSENGSLNKMLENNKISEVLTNDHIRQLQEWTGKRLLFACFSSNIRNQGMSGRQFHLLCDNYSETITIVVTKYATIGGYTSKDWSGNQDKYDDKAFVFNLDIMKKYPIVPGKIAICPNEVDLPVFGSDIALVNNNHHALFPSSYGTSADREEFGVASTLIQPTLVEVIVVN